MDDNGKQLWTDVYLLWMKHFDRNYLNWNELKNDVGYVCRKYSYDPFVCNLIYACINSIEDAHTDPNKLYKLSRKERKVFSDKR